MSIVKESLSHMLPVVCKNVNQLVIPKSRVNAKRQWLLDIVSILDFSNRHPSVFLADIANNPLDRGKTRV